MECRFDNSQLMRELAVSFRHKRALGFFVIEISNL
jgi:hypothetical protein